MKRNWTLHEDNMLKTLVNVYGHQWSEISSHFVNRRPSQIAARWEKCLNPKITKGPFTDEEDDIVRKFVEENGPRNWPKLAEILKVRSSKQCRERWCNHLDPNIFHDPWTPEEDYTIFKLYTSIGPKWSVISKYVPGRPDNSVKNRYYSSISKRIVLQSNGEPSLLPDSSTRKPRSSKLSNKRPTISNNNSTEVHSQSENQCNSKELNQIFDEIEMFEGVDYQFDFLSGNPFSNDLFSEL